MPSREDLAEAFTAAYDADDSHSRGIFAGLEVIIPMIEETVRPGPCSVNSTPPALRPEDSRYRALQLAVEHGKHDPQYGETAALAVAETFRKYLETGATDVR